MRRILQAAFLFIASVVFMACTIEADEATRWASVAVVSTSPSHLQEGVARNSPVSFAFSRPIDPGSIGTRPLVITSAEVSQRGSFHYNPLSRQLTFTPRGLFRLNLAYLVELDEDLRGLRNNEPVTPESIVFITGEEELELETEETPDYSTEVFPIFQQSCAFSACHAPPNAVASLDLSSNEGILATAINTPSAGWGSWDRIDPGSAAWSVLIYKMLGEESIRGDSMPPGGILDWDTLDVIARWIDDGAKVDLQEDEP